MLTRQILRALLALALVPGALSACQVIAGIEERKLDPTASGTGKLCSDYCDAVMSACVDDHAVYPNREQCMGVCAKLPPGDTEEHANDNSIACRLRYAISAKREPEDCKNAGPGGNDICGSDCEGYCSIFPKACASDFIYEDEARCLEVCEGLKKQDSYNLTDDHEGDTIECRLVHSSSATVDPSTHCSHATIVPAKPWCILKDDDEATCEDYCRIAVASCSGSLQQYDDLPQCLAACATLTPGVNKDTTANTVGCRRYHAFSSAALPETHCFHAGPTGDGHCGGKTGNCESYCAMAAGACPAEFAAQFANEAACLDACADLPESASDSKFSLESAAASKGYQCRVLHTLRAFEDKTECAAALGGGDCE